MTKFLYYVLSSKVFDDFFAINQGGTTIVHLYQETFMNFAFPLPSVLEQLTIADYLDAKCSQIDSTIKKEKLLIEKLKLYKRSIITEAVTKGLDSKAKMKPSGIEWIEEIPNGWNVSKIKYEFYNLDSRRQPINSENRTCGENQFDYYGASGVIDKIGDYLFDEPLILIGEDGANLLLRNLPLVYVAKGKYWVNNHAHVLKPKEHNFIAYMAYQLELLDLSIYLSGSTQPKLTQDELSTIPVIVPPMKEQQLISEHLDDKCTQIDNIITGKQKLIDKLTVYKKSLIYECVTGKREVL